MIIYHFLYINVILRPGNVMSKSKLLTKIIVQQVVKINLEEYLVFWVGVFGIWASVLEIGLVCLILE